MYNLGNKISTKAPWKRKDDNWKHSKHQHRETERRRVHGHPERHLRNGTILEAVHVAETRLSEHCLGFPWTSLCATGNAKGPGRMMLQAVGCLRGSSTTLGGFTALVMRRCRPAPCLGEAGLSSLRTAVSLAHPENGLDKMQLEPSLLAYLERAHKHSGSMWIAPPHISWGYFSG